MAELNSMGRATVLACPKCATTLHEVEDGDALRFCCWFGHRYEPEEICPGIADSLEAALPEVVDALTR